MLPSLLLSLLLPTSRTSAIPSQPPFSNSSVLPTHFGLLLFPHFQSLDVFGPMDVLNTLSMLYSNSTTISLSIYSKTIDPVTTAMQGGFGQSIVPTTTFAEYLAKDWENRHQDEKGEIEVLIVPGGGGTRQNMSEEIAFVKSVYPKLKYIISVCTGATLLSRAGILDNHRATTNKRAWTWATSTGPNVTWVPTARWVEDGNIWTSSGVAAGIDAIFAWVGRVYGEEVADYLALSNEYGRERDWRHDPFAEVWGVPGS